MLCLTLSNSIYLTTFHLFCPSIYLSSNYLEHGVPDEEPVLGPAGRTSPSSPGQDGGVEEGKNVCVCVCVFVCVRELYYVSRSKYIYIYVHELFMFICVHVFVCLFVELFVVDGRRCVYCMKVYCIFYAIFFIFLCSFFA